MLTKLFGVSDPSLVERISMTGYAIPVVEILIAMLLAFPGVRNLGVYLAWVSHCFALIYLSPLGMNDNSVVYPWNIGMMVFVYLLFYNSDRRLIPWRISGSEVRISVVLAVLMTWILPSLNLFNRWDHYLSFSLYSDKPHTFFIAVADEALPTLPPAYKNYIYEIEGMTGGQVIDVNKWSMGALNVPFYPETRVFKVLARSFCDLGIDDQQVVFLEVVKPFNEQKLSTFRCSDL
jgi:hypothetical protein